MIPGAGGRLFEGGARLVTPPVFESVLDAEMRRAVRSQSFLTLVVLETRREWDGMTLVADDGIVSDVAQLVGSEIRDTDVMGTGSGVLSLMLIEADYESSRTVIDRLIQRIDRYAFPAPVHISVGAACYPTHAVDADTLRQQALAHQVVNWRQPNPKPQIPRPNDRRVADHRRRPRRDRRAVARLGGRRPGAHARLDV